LILYLFNENVDIKMIMVIQSKI